MSDVAPTAKTTCVVVTQPDGTRFAGVTTDLSAEPVRLENTVTIVNGIPAIGPETVIVFRAESVVEMSGSELAHYRAVTSSHPTGAA